MVVTANLDRIVEMGRRRGGLTVEDLSKHLPIETLSPTELAEVLATIENAGVTVEIDPALLRGRPRAVNDVPGAQLPPSAAETPRDDQERLSKLDSSIRHSKHQAEQSRGRDQYKGGTAFLAIAVVICILLMIGLWLFDRGL
jgi:Sigma-70 factor, region 1.1